MDAALQPPPSVFIRPYAAHLGSFFLTTSYVGSLYLSKVFRKAQVVKIPSDGSANVPAPIIAADVDEESPKEGERDHPKVIMSRMKAVGWATVISMGTVVAICQACSGSDWSQSVAGGARLMGLSRLPVTIAPYTLVPVLFIGPLVARYLDEGLPWQYFGYLGYRQRGSSLGLVEVRNYIVGPLTEELVFRSALIGLNILGRLSFWKLVFVTPLWFGIAHAHHAVEVFNKGGRTSQAAFQAVVGALFQLSYTTLFGWYASYLFLRTGSIVPPLIAHVFCNYMGIYLPGHAIRRYPGLVIPIWTSYLLGIGAFAYGLKWL